MLCLLLVIEISHVLTMWYVKCKPLAYIINPQTLKNVLMALGDSQVMLLSTSHCASCEVYLRKHGAVQTGRWVGRSLVGTFVQTGREEDQRGMHPHSRFRQGGSGCAACRLHV